MYRFATVARACILLLLGWCVGVMFTMYGQVSQEPFARGTRGGAVPSDYIRKDLSKDQLKSILKNPSLESDGNSNIFEQVTNDDFNKKLKVEVDQRKANIHKYLESDQRKDFVKSLQMIKSELASAHRFAHSGKAMLHIKESFGLIEQMLSAVDPLLHPDILSKNASDKLPVCPEIYKGSTYDYPFFYKGFVPTNCTNVRPFETVLTILFDFHNEPPEKRTTNKIKTILTNVAKFYKGLPVAIATSVDLNVAVPSHVRVVKVDKAKPAGYVWNELIKAAKTEYVFVGRDIDYFDWNSRLDRLVREVFYLGVPVAASSVRIENGHWSMGCQQVAYRNYTVSYREGYDISQHECVFCGYVRGPFVALKSTMTDNPFGSQFNEVTVFEDFFMKLHQRQSLSIVCPDTMNYIRDNEHGQNDKLIWIPFAKKYGLNRIQLSSGTIHSFSCGEVGTSSKTAGVAVPPCSLQKLSDAVKFFMSTCESENIMCELQEGTLMGAVKLNKMLPWERDADLTILSGNYSAFQKLTDKFQKGGYSLRDLGGVWCCADGRKAGGKFAVGVSGWNIEVYGQHIMDTEKLANLSMPPTKVFLDGLWVNVPRNPALYVRNRYGKEAFRHAQHWMTRGMSDGWANYNTAQFSPCPKKGSHACLDQYLTDGNLQFDFPTP